MGKVVGDVLDMGYHRNGISGEGFWTILFRGAEGSDVEGEVFVSTFFPDDEEEPTGEIRTTVLRMEALNEGDANDGLRGDYFHDELKALVGSYVWPHERPAPTVDRRAAVEHTKTKGE